MSVFTPAESLHRLVKHAIDSGAAESITQAEAMFRGYRLNIDIGASAASDPVHQAALLTAVAVGRRVFLGGVTVTGDLAVPLSALAPLGPNLAAAVAALGGKPGCFTQGAPEIAIGGVVEERRNGFRIRTAAAGWRGGVLPSYSPLSPEPGPAMPIAGMLSGALAVNEAFLSVSGGAPAAGRRVLGLSLWQPDAAIDWLKADPAEPVLTYLPSNLWLLGLGHLGQAYLWGLSLLPYRDPAKVSLVLQDIDIITPSTESTSILTDATMVGLKKTRAMAAWTERRGFATTIHERLFDADFACQPSEPAIALCGLDNASGRRALDQVGFKMVIEAGLGRGHRDFRTMRLHTLPGPRQAAEIWKGTAAKENVEEQRAYAQLLARGTLDRCGVTLLAGKAVGAPFVGAVAGALAISEVLRHLHGGPVHQLIDLDLLSLEHRITSRHRHDFGDFNPGFVPAR
ncbi:thiamine biosynthesis protein ThiF [Roseomonas sp. JC162]|uniref:Thiamine biosynthesis protein ThiF n=1 Tax=Neoroseomonas marina TaxID=1232220 RepID=A0A848E8V5_9PROT|nr:thiamine biosynthesis protein ThiF [Neoroseomonas marina]NMJ40881.1 thiamine biosynthesis protein ThiF [Neoroseomonas marina]